MSNWFILCLAILTLGACIGDIIAGNLARAGMFAGWVISDICLLWVK